MFKISCYYFRVIHHSGNGSTLHCGTRLCICNVLQLCITYYLAKTLKIGILCTINILQTSQIQYKQYAILIKGYVQNTTILFLLFLQYILQYAYCFLKALNTSMNYKMCNLQNIFTQNKNSMITIGIQYCLYTIYCIYKF